MGHDPVKGENVVAWAVLLRWSQPHRLGERLNPEQKSLIRSVVPRSESFSSASRSLASRVRQGVQWKIVSQGTSLILQLATTVVLARLLSPEEFGLAAMVLVFRRLLFLFSDFAFTPALVQRRHLTDKDRSTAFYPV